MTTTPKKNVLKFLRWFCRKDEESKEKHGGVLWKKKQSITPKGVKGL
jgi:hypothetical protein